MSEKNPPARAPSLETTGMSKSFGALKALQDVSIKVPPGSFHALLGENGAGKSTLVKCIMGFYTADRGQLLLNGEEGAVHNPRDAQALGIGMVYQHFTLVPALTAAENLVVSRADAPGVIEWRKETKSLESFLDRMPFRVPLDKPVSAMAAGVQEPISRRAVTSADGTTSVKCWYTMPIPCAWASRGLRTATSSPLSRSCPRSAV